MLFRGTTAYSTTADEVERKDDLDAYLFSPNLTLSEEAVRILKSRRKRLLDLGGATLLSVFFLPALVLIALAVAVDGRGPIIFRQQRYGAFKKVFWLYKFRSMNVCESSGSFLQAKPNDIRVTPLGRILRRTSLDELPQLFNVLEGHMSLVGPRPHAVAMDDEFAPHIPCYADRHLVKPGLTGLAQVRGFRGPTDGFDKIAGRLREDRQYISGWSLALDLKILLKTPTQLLGPNAH
jgi:putative colanic acid biosynthesis UDP-glucose lipid carrier transferase